MFARGPVADLFVPLAAQHRLMLTSSIAMLASYDDFARNCRTSGLPDCSPGDHSSRQTSPNHSDYEISHQKPEAEMKSRDSDVEGPKAAVHTELNMNKRSLDDGEDAILDVETCCNDVAASNDVNIEASVSAKRERENNEKTIKKEVLKFGIDRILIETSSTSSAAPSATTLMRRPSLSDDVSKPDRRSASEDLSASPRCNSWISQLYSTTIPTSSVRCRPGFSDSYSARSSLFLSSSDHVPSLLHDRYGQVLNHQLPSTVGREESAPSRHSAFAFQHGGTPSHRSYDVISSGYQLIPSNGIGYRSNSTQNSCSPGSKKKRSWSRAVFSNLQRKGLEKRFEVQKYVTKPDRRQLAAMLGLTDAQVKVWFQNRRMKWRHQEEAKKTNGEQDPLRQVITTSRSDACVVAGGQNGQTNHCCSDDDDDDSSVEDACDLGIGCGSRGRPVSMTSTVCSVTSYDKSPSSGRQSNSRKLASVMSVADILDLRSPVVSSTCRQTLI